MEDFLRATEIIDWDSSEVLAKAKELSDRAPNQQRTARCCFEWVRDNIQHSADFRRDPITCCASDVLATGTGYCYAKSHLLAALLRANGIPAGFCYQRLSINNRGAPYSLHGFNAVQLPEVGWYRMDARGNKPGVDAQFSPPIERLAFRLNFPEERDFPEILANPLPVVVSALRHYCTWEDLYQNLPDWELPSLTI